MKNIIKKILLFPAILSFLLVPSFMLMDRYYEFNNESIVNHSRDLDSVKGVGEAPIQLTNLEIEKLSIGRIDFKVNYFADLDEGANNDPIITKQYVHLKTFSDGPEEIDKDFTVVGNVKYGSFYIVVNDDCFDNYDGDATYLFQLFVETEEGQNVSSEIYNPIIGSPRPIEKLDLEIISGEGFHEGVLNGTFEVPDDEVGFFPTEVYSIEMAIDIGVVKNEVIDLSGSFKARLSDLIPGQTSTVTVTIKGNWGEDIVTQGQFTPFKDPNGYPVTFLKIDTVSENYSGGKFEGSYGYSSYDFYSPTEVYSIDLEVDKGKIENEVIDFGDYFTKEGGYFSGDVTGLEPGETATVTATITGNWKDEGGVFIITTEIQATTTPPADPIDKDSIEYSVLWSGDNEIQINWSVKSDPDLEETKLNEVSLKTNDGNKYFSTDEELIELNGHFNLHPKSKKGLLSGELKVIDSYGTEVKLNIDLKNQNEDKGIFGMSIFTQNLLITLLTLILIMLFLLIINNSLSIKKNNKKAQDIIDANTKNNDGGSK